MENDSSPKTALSQFQHDAGEFEVGKITGKQQIGGIIKIKVSKSFPHLSKYIGTY